MNAQDRNALRELAKAYRELADQDVNAKRERRIRDMHALRPVRPPVWIDELPWNEMDVGGELSLHCEDEEARSIEQFFRRVLFRWKHFQADMVVDGVFYVNKAYTATGIGVKIREETIPFDPNNRIVSHRYEDQLKTEASIEALQLPLVKADPEADARNLDRCQDLLGDILPVKLRGYGVYHAPWDEISMLRGVEPILIDMVERPEFIHRTIEKFTQIGLSRYEQMENENLLDYNQPSLHCTPPYSDELPAKDYDGGKVRLKDIWFRGMAQMFSAVSPAMHEEFDLQYMRRIMDKCALTYYGCCEPLDKLIPRLKKIPNLRKIGVTPWADIQSSAEQIGGDYVFARKLNPAHVAVRTDPDVVRREVEQTIQLCLQYKCPYEFVLKDISTVSYKPGNIFLWTRTVMETIDRYYA